MLYIKRFKTTEIQIMLSNTWRQTWTLGIQFHWNWLIKKNCPKLDENLFAFDVHILCFEFSFEYWWDK